MNAHLAACAGLAPFPRRIAGVLAGALIGFPAWAESACDSLPEPRRALCEEVLECMALEDADARGTCIDAAQQQHETPPTSQQPARSDTARETIPALILEEQTVASPGERTPPTQEEAPTPPTRKAPTRDASPPRADDGAPREPPERFTAQVTRIHQSILDRQLVALDNRYLFVSDRARQARLKVGHTVDAKKVKKRFGSGRTWRITAPTRHAFDAARIRCESSDIGVDDRRRCAQMLDR